MAATIEGEDRVMATAQKIVKSFKTSKDVTEDMLAILSSFDNRLSNITSLMSSKTDRFEAAVELILRSDSNFDSSSHSSSSEESPDKAAEYLAAVDEILQSMEQLSIQSEPDAETMDRAQNALQLAMSRLEDKFDHILTINSEPLDTDRPYGLISSRKVSLSFASNDGEIQDFGSLGEDDGLSGYCHKRGASLGYDVCPDLIPPDALVELKEITDRMIRSGHEQECVNTYRNVRCNFLSECMWRLDFEKLSIEEVQRIEWRLLDEKMKKWIQAVKIVVRVLLSAEKRLCEHIFSGSELTEMVFVQTATVCMRQLLNFGQAVAIGRKSAEKLFRILDMHDVLVNVLPDLQALFAHELGESVCSEAKLVLDGLGKAAIGTFVEFENAVQGEQSRRPVQGGDIHPLTRYVMNYVKLVVDYSDSLNALLGTIEDETDHLQNDNGENLELENVSSISRRLLSLMMSLESNLEEKSKLYEDGPMQYIFQMNNILYIVQKVKDSELRNLLGDQWIRKRRGQIRQYATSYLRSSWSKALSCLKDEGIGGSTSNASKMALKERFKNFNASFEDIYRNQTAWKVPDSQLREELRISISEKVLPAYRAFMGRFRGQLESGRNAGKYIKYNPDDLENFLLDLFEGTPLVLNHMRRKST